MIYWQIFMANFVANILGYGGGPATIPLLEYEVVNRYGWFTVSEFSEMVALGNGLPGPIATKMAGYIGYEMGGGLGALIGLFASVAPSMILMIILLAVLLKFKDSPKVKRLTQFIRPSIAVLLAVMTYSFFETSFIDAGSLHTVIIAILSLVFLEYFKVSPVYVILGALTYGAIFLG